MSRGLQGIATLAAKQAVMATSKKQVSNWFLQSFLAFVWLTLDEAEREKVFISPGWVQGRALTVRNISFKPLQGYNSFNLIVIQHFGYFFSSAGCGAELSLYYSAHINPVKQETEQLIKGNITLARDPITNLCSKTNNSKPGKCYNRLFNFHKTVQWLQNHYNRQ